MISRIPLFPLKLVVFPNSKYSLHIFEERYKKMISRCLVNNRDFGIVAFMENDFAKVGSFVTISEVKNIFDNGEMDIVIKGLNRFHIVSTEIHSDGYYIAYVEDYSDNGYETNEELVEELHVVFDRFLRKVDFKLEEAFWKNYEIADIKSFKLAEKSGLTLEQQQTILSLQDENKRIEYLIDHFSKLEKKISETEILKLIVMNDGYIN